ncbi:GM2 ganglioside activator [Branchiostoma belcheri]|nr:GM2 ganglioside activator [Branchiostoma belcheri]
MDRKLVFPSLFFAAIAVIFVASAVKPSDKASLKMILDLLRIPQTLERFKTGNEVDYQSHDLQVLKFSWHNCGTADDPVKVKDVTLTPDPVKLPGEVKTGFTAQLLKTVDNLSRLHWSSRRSVGSCTYTDLCAKIPGKPTDACPPPLSTYNIPCHCPFKSGNYTLPPSNFDLPSIGSLPEWLEEGDYSVQATISSSTRLACYRAELSLTK